MENICDWVNCKKTAKFKAPKERDNSKNFKWLCEEHIKLFNKNWNYFDGMNQNEIESFLKADITWHRPTQKFSSLDNHFNILWNNALSDKFKIFKTERKRNSQINNRILCSRDKDAFEIMELEIDTDWADIQKKFKTLVKNFTLINIPVINSMRIN